MFHARSFKRDFTLLNIWDRVIQCSPPSQMTASHEVHLYFNFGSEIHAMIIISLTRSPLSCTQCENERGGSFLKSRFVSFPPRPGPGPLGISSLISYNILRTAGVFLAQQKQTRGEIFCKRVCLLILQLIHHYPVNSSSVSAVMPSSCARQYFWSKRSLPKWPSSIFSLASRFAFREGDRPSDRDFTSNINGKIVIAAAKILCRDATVEAIFINNHAR